MLGKSILDVVKDGIEGVHNKAIYSKDVHIERLEAVVEALSSRLNHLNKRKMVRVDKTTEKWRNRCYYLEKKLANLEELIALLKGVKNEKEGQGLGE